MRSSITCNPPHTHTHTHTHTLNHGDEIEDEIGGPCSMHEQKKSCVQYFGRKQLHKGASLEDEEYIYIYIYI